MLDCIGVGVGGGIGVGMSDIGESDEGGQGVVANGLAQRTCSKGGVDMLVGDWVKWRMVVQKVDKSSVMAGAVGWNS